MEVFLMAVMNKTLIIHHINDIDNIPAMERWFVHHHCPEVMAQEPWLTRYVMYRVIDVYKRQGLPPAPMSQHIPALPQSHLLP